MDASVSGAVAAWSLIIGAITPFLVAVVNQPTWSSRQRQITAVVISILVGAVTVVVGGTVADWSLNLPNILTIIAAVVGAAQATYATIFNKPAKAVEVKTSAVSGDAGSVSIRYSAVFMLGMLLLALCSILFVSAVESVRSLNL